MPRSPPRDGCYSLPAIEEAIEIVGENGLQCPEFALLEGELLLALGDGEGAEARFRRGHAAAGHLGLRMPQLRAATKLSCRRPDAIALLRSAYDTFSEGFETPDLVDARKVLDDVDARVG
jgi:hypothetical protein